jgi:DNA transformation protein and related proteins
MRTKDSLANYVAEQLSFLGRISSRSIFGATGIFIDERLLGIVVNNDCLYLHTGPTNRDDYVSRGMPQFKPYPNAFDLTTDHHKVPAEVLGDESQLKAWGERALKAAVDAAKAKQLAGIERSRHAKQAKRKKTD